MSARKYVGGHRYTPPIGPAIRTMREWRIEIGQILAQGGRKARDPDGVLAVYDARGARVLEVYDKTSKVRAQRGET